MQTHTVGTLTITPNTPQILAWRLDFIDGPSFLQQHLDKIIIIECAALLIGSDHDIEGQTALETILSWARQYSDRTLIIFEGINDYVSRYINNFNWQ